MRKSRHIFMVSMALTAMLSTTAFAGVKGHGVNVTVTKFGNTSVTSYSIPVNMADGLGSWRADQKGWWWQNPDGTWPVSTWAWLDGNRDGISGCYYFGADGYMLSNTFTPDGYFVDGNGAWVNGGVVQKKGAVVTHITSTGNDDAMGYDDESDDGSYDEVESEYSNDSGSFDADKWADEVIELVNKEREKKGRSELSKDDTLTEVAELRAEEASRKWSHTRPDGSSCFTAFDEAGFDKNAAAGENLAKGYTSPKDVMKGWMNSSGHKRNILSEKFAYIGVGIYKKGNTYYWAQAFGGESLENSENVILDD